MGIHAGPLCTTHLEQKDSTRIKRAVDREAVVAKERRKSKRAAENGAEEAHNSTLVSTSHFLIWHHLGGFAELETATNNIKHTSKLIIHIPYVLYT